MGNYLALRQRYQAPLGSLGSSTRYVRRCKQVDQEPKSMDGLVLEASYGIANLAADSFFNRDINGPAFIAPPGMRIWPILLSISFRTHRFNNTLNLIT